MAEAATARSAEETPPAKRGRKGTLAGLAAGLALGGAAFAALYTGAVDPAALLASKGAGPAALDVAFVPLDPIMVSLPPGASARHLRFVGQLEVEPALAGEVAAVTPRILDALNAYLRAVEPADLETPAALARLRAQMLRRVEIVAGEGRVRDLLVTEFVLN